MCIHLNINKKINAIGHVRSRYYHQATFPKKQSYTCKVMRGHKRARGTIQIPPPYCDAGYVFRQKLAVSNYRHSSEIKGKPPLHPLKKKKKKKNMFE